MAVNESTDKVIGQTKCAQLAVTGNNVLFVLGVQAAYNCGPGTINKAIRRAGGATDYWTIYNYLPKETRGYVPAFIAANYIMTYYCEHGICPMETQLPNATDTIHINKDLHLQQVAEVCNINLDQLRSCKLPIPDSSLDRCRTGLSGNVLPPKLI